MRFHERTSLGDYLAIHGLMLVAIIGLLVLQLIGASFPSLSIGPQLSSVRAKVRRPATVGISIAPSAVPATLIGLANPLTVGLAAGGALLAAGLLARNLPLFLIGAIVLVATCAYVRRQEPAHLLVLLMTGTGLILSLAVEFLVLKGDIGRMNTVFKFYLQIWMLLGTAAGIAVAVAIMERYVRRRAGFDVWFVVLGILLLAAAMYPAMSIPARVSDRYAALPPTLDGMAYMDHATYNDTPEGRQPVSFSLAGDAAAIQWLRDSVDGSPVVLEATIPGYRWGSRVSVYTGLPTVLGWDWHQTQQRPGFGMMIQERREDVAYMFGAVTPFDLITPLLDRYHVRLIYVGDLERAYYDPVGLAKFDDAVLAGELTVVYQAQGVTIYRYNGESSA
jgi:YYY domain-containing protein